MAHNIKPLKLLSSRYLKKNNVTIGALKHEQKFHNRYWEKRLKVNTYGNRDVDIDDGLRYEPAPYLIIQEVLNRLNLGANDVFVDLGCGKGRALLMAMRRPIKKVVGVEYDKQCLDIARSNLANAQGPELALIHGLAQEFDFSEASCLFLYNPFGEQTLREVMQSLTTSLKEKPRRFQIVYLNPQHNNAIEETRLFNNTENWPTSIFPDFDVYPVQPIAVSFWEAP